MTPRRLIESLARAAALLSTLPLSAQFTWTGAVNALYENSGNWIPTNPPNNNQNGDSIVFPDVADQTVTLGGQRRLNLVTFDAPDAYTIDGSGPFRYVDLNYAGTGGLSFLPNVTLQRDSFEGGRMGGGGTGTITAAGGLSGDDFSKAGPWDLEVTVPSPAFNPGTTPNNALGNSSNTINVWEGSWILSGTATLPSQTRVQVGNGFSVTQLGAGGFAGPLARPTQAEAAFVLDNSGTALNDRLTDDTVLRPRGGGTFRLIGNASADVDEDVGLLQIGGDGASGTVEVVSLSPSQQTRLTFDSLNDGLAGTDSTKRLLIFKAPGATLGANTAGGPRILFTSEPNEFSFDNTTDEAFIQNVTNNGNFSHPAILVDANGASFALYDEAIVGGAPRGVRAFEGLALFTDTTLDITSNGFDLQFDGDVVIDNSAGAFPQPRLARFNTPPGGQTVTLLGNNPDFGVLDGLIKDGTGDLTIDGTTDSIFFTASGSTFYFNGGTTTFTGDAFNYSQPAIGGPGQLVINADLVSTGFSTFIIDGETGNTTDDVVVTGVATNAPSLQGDGRLAFRGDASGPVSGSFGLLSGTLVLARSTQAAQDATLGTHFSGALEIAGGGLEAQGFAPNIDVLSGIDFTGLPGGGSASVAGEPFTFNLSGDILTDLGGQNGVTTGLYLDTHVTFDVTNSATVAMRPNGGGNSQPNAVSRFFFGGPGDLVLPYTLRDDFDDHKLGFIFGGSGTYRITGPGEFSGEVIANGGGTVVWNGTRDPDLSTVTNLGPQFLSVSDGTTWSGTGVYDTQEFWLDNPGNTQDVTVSFTDGAVLAPGASVGTFTFGQPDGSNGAFSMDNSSTLQIEADGSGVDQLVVYGNATFDNVTIDLIDLGGATTQNVVIVDVLGGGSLSANISLNIVSPTLAGSSVNVVANQIVLSLQAGAVSDPFEQWAIDNGVSNDPLADDDNDGANQLIEYNGNSDPDDPSSVPAITLGSVMAGSDTFPTITFVRRIDDPNTMAVAQVSEDLSVATPGFVGPAASPAKGTTLRPADTVAIDSAYEQVTFQSNTAFANANEQFLQVGVTRTTP
ncbi:MAG: beta strand repeat-containing protein [Opitutales bacterium]